MIKHPGKNLLKPCRCTRGDTDLYMKKKIRIKVIILDNIYKDEVNQVLKQKIKTEKSFLCIEKA
jgi:hypothetical protein